MMVQINQHNSLDSQSLSHSWLSDLTRQSIPEESDCSSLSSTEECYLIVDFERTSSLDSNQDLCYAKIWEDDQFVQSMISEVKKRPSKFD